MFVDCWSRFNQSVRLHTLNPKFGVEFGLLGWIMDICEVQRQRHHQDEGDDQPLWEGRPWQQGPRQRNRQDLQRYLEDTQQDPWQYSKDRPWDLQRLVKTRQRQIYNQNIDAEKCVHINLKSHCTANFYLIVWLVKLWNLHTHMLCFCFYIFPRSLPLGQFSWQS